MMCGVSGQNVLHILGQFGKENAAAIFDLILECRPQYPIDQLDANGNTGIYRLSSLALTLSVSINHCSLLWWISLNTDHVHVALMYYLFVVSTDLPTLVNCQMGHAPPFLVHFHSPTPLSTSPLPFPTYPSFHPPFRFPLNPIPSLSSPCPIPSPIPGREVWDSAVSSPCGSRQSPAAKQILVQLRPKPGIWCWVEGFAKWVNRRIFTNLRNLWWG